MLQYGPDLIRLRDQNKGFEARGPARDPLGEPGVLDAPRAAGAHGVSPGQNSPATSPPSASTPTRRSAEAMRSRPSE